MIQDLVMIQNLPHIQPRARLDIQILGLLLIIMILKKD